ncbi:MAG: radical SAM protein, partial [Vibrio sp.]|nr:radical SAM protein [Vibrio sp.]
AKIRIIGITIETRPDWINEKEIIFLRKLGVTRVELGVQNISDGILSLNNRTHTTNDIINATK